MKTSAGKPARPEQEIFNDLARLCASPGYVHVIAAFCYRDSIIRWRDALKAEDLNNLYGFNRLIRTEVTTLVGLLIKQPVTFEIPAVHVLQGYFESTQRLLNELHQSMGAAWIVDFDLAKATDPNFKPFTSGEALREPIFYGGESAYSFQYREFSALKYASDKPWLQANKGFTLDDARTIAKAACSLQSKKLAAVGRDLQKRPKEQWTLLTGFEMSIAELCTESGLDESLVRQVTSTFTLAPAEFNEGFKSLGDFNLASAAPFIPGREPDTVVLLQQYTLLEALYEAPFYWMGADKKYAPTALKHRGQFTESLSKDCLMRVFGAANVYAGVNIMESKTSCIGEIDALVLFGDRAIVLQAKSKRLTQDARRGNDLKIRDDFKKSVQDSYDQGLLCAKALSNPAYTFVLPDGRTVAMPKNLEETYIFCVVSDHYPALSFQARQFLKFEESEQIPPPFVMDVFLLDAMTEMLTSPLMLLSYAARRMRYNDSLMLMQELTALSYHLKQNLWVSDEFNMVVLGEDIAADLDVAMLARREGLPGAKTPEGILTKLPKLAIGRLLKSIEQSADPGKIALGFMLLRLGEESMELLSKGIDRIVAESRMDKKNHDVAMATVNGDGITVHCNQDPVEIAQARLEDMCRRRKYVQKAKNWCGICIDPVSREPRFGVSMSGTWEYDSELENATRFMARPQSPQILNPAGSRKKLGRNDVCWCGSGRKYKKCCLASDERGA